MEYNNLKNSKNMTIETKEKYLIITADEGMVLTEWKEGNDILHFSFAEKQFSPLNYDIARLREITKEECHRLLDEQERVQEENNIPSGMDLDFEE
jgi:hypothetical protein